MSGILTSFLGNSGGYTTIYTGSLQSGVNGLSPNLYGYIPSFAGSLSLNTFTPAGFPLLTITFIVDTVSGGGGPKSELIISGFSGPPGANFLTSFQWLNDAEIPFAGTYQYNPGTPNTATWTFSTGSTVFNLQSRVGQTNTLILKGII